MKKRFLFLSIAMILCLACFISCSKSEMAVGDGGYFDGADKEYGNGSIGSTGVPESSTDIISTDRKIIKTVYEHVQTEKYDDFMKALRALINDCGGYISSASHNGESYYSSNSYRNSNLTVKIPAERLDEFTSTVDGLGIVYSYNESMNDVTGAYVDIESRISVLEAEETALLQMLSQAQTTSDTLEIRQMLNGVQADLASLKAQKNSYDSLIAYSTVHINVYEVRKEETVNPGFFEEVGDEFGESMYNLGQNLRDFGVWFFGNIVQIVIFAAFATGACILIVRILKKRRAKRAKIAENTENGEENRD